MSQFISIVNGGSVNSFHMLSRGYCDVKEGIGERAGQEGSRCFTLFKKYKESFVSAFFPEFEKREQTVS